MPTDEAADLKNWGCSYAQYADLQRMNGPTRAYQEHRRNARKRGISWEFTIWEWWTIWQNSGHWDKRGKGQGHYVMCRRGDVGPYAAGNVYIALGAHNNSVQPLKKSNLPTGVGKRGNSYRAKRMFNAKIVCLGSFPTAEQAGEAYRNAVAPQQSQNHGEHDQNSTREAR